MSSTNSLSSKLLYGLGAGIGVTLLSGVASYWYYKYYKKDVMPQKWRRVGILQQINIFPIKSCAALKLTPDDEVTCEVLGLRLDSFQDRALMLIDDNNQMITARVYPKMVLVQAEIASATKLIFNAPGMQVLELDFATLAQEAPGEDVHTAVWMTKIDAMLCGEKYDKWFSKYILQKENGLRLVHYAYPKPVRAVNSQMAKEPFISKEDTGTFGDATSYMLINLASINDLNTRTTRFVNPLQFRGNFQLQMDVDAPYAEDKWNWIKIGDENGPIFRVVSPCTRCIFPNIDVLTAERNPDNEPSKVLKKYRMKKGYATPVFGIHLGVRQTGVVKVNNIIYVEDTSL